MWYDLFDGKLSNKDIRKSVPYVDLFTFRMGPEHWTANNVSESLKLKFN